MAWKLSGPTLYLYEKVKVSGEQKVHARLRRHWTVERREEDRGLLQQIAT